MKNPVYIDSLLLLGDRVQNIPNGYRFMDMNVLNSIFQLLLCPDCMQHNIEYYESAYTVRPKTITSHLTLSQAGGAFFPPPCLFSAITL